MRVLCFADTRFPIERANGVQTMATCHAMAERGHDVTLVVRPDTAAPGRDPFEFYALSRQPRLTIRTIHARSGPRARRVQFLLAASALVLRSRDVVFTRDLGLAAFLLRWPRVCRPRLVYESHGMAPVVAAEMPVLLGRPHLAPSPSKLARLDRRERRVWRRAAAYVTLTRCLAEDLVKRYGAREQLYVVPDGARDSDSSQPSRQSVEVSGGGGMTVGTEGPIVGYAGHLYPWKGVDVLLHALALTPGSRGLIIGGHPAEADAHRVRTLISALGIGDRVELTGLVSPGDVRRHLARASILVLPNTPSAISERYTSPLKLFEYLAAGRPIVASDLPAIREILTDDVTALLVVPGDASAIAAALRRLAGDARLADRLAAAGRALASTYTWASRARALDAPLEAARG